MNLEHEYEERSDYLKNFVLVCLLRDSVTTCHRPFLLRMISATLLSQLPKHVQRLVHGVSNRSVADFQQLCDQLADYSESELCILQPVIYMHLDPDRVPIMSIPAATTDIELARWSLVGIVTIFGNIGNSSGTEAHRYFVSAWNRVVPWLIFFHDQFIMCRANYRPVDKKIVIDLVGKILQSAYSASDPGNTPFLATTPTLWRLIIELWLLALDVKDKDALFSAQHPLSHSRYRYLTPLELMTPILVTGCIRDEPFMAIVLEVSGDTGTVASTALKYVKTIRLMALDPDAISGLPTSLELLSPMLSYCVRFIREISKQSAAVREECIIRQSIKEIFSVSRVIQLLLSSTGTMEQRLKPSLSWSFGYLADLLDHADDTISVLYQALRSHAFEIAMGLKGPSVEVEFNGINKSFPALLYNYLVHDKILTYACKHVDAWSNALGPIVRQDETTRDRWSIVEMKIRLYANLKSREEMIRRPSPDEKGWVLRCHCRDTAEDNQLRQCAGCQVARYCSKRCQRDSWYSHHKAAVGSSTPHSVKRSLCGGIFRARSPRRGASIRRIRNDSLSSSL
ncbi:hypothetical protein EDB19DRAFT_1746006 [Suillus lakei]|nr:hypothetical protein EDB19DRAFT_1746006 [Suillus lakei]